MFDFVIGTAILLFSYIAFNTKTGRIDLIEALAQELHRVDPDNAKLKHYLALDNFEGGELRKAVAKVRK